MVTDYLQQLTEEGELDSHGRITLDPEQARQKLAEHRFVDFVEGLLALIGAAILGPASQIRVRRQGLHWEIVSDAIPPTVEQVQNLIPDLFRGGQPASVRELALAVNSLHPKHCSKLAIFLRHGRALSLGATLVSPPPSPPFTQTIVLAQNQPWSRLWEWFKRRCHPADDLRILRRRTRWSPVPVYFEAAGAWQSSYDLDPPQAPKGSLAMISVESIHPCLRLPPYQLPGASELPCWERRSRSQSSLRCALLPGDPADSSLLLVYRGLTLAHHKLRSTLFRFEGVLNTENLDLDASRRHIVANQRLRQRLETVRNWVSEGTAGWLRQLDPARLPEATRSHLTAALMRLGPGQKVLTAALGPLPLIPLCDGKSWISLDDLRITLQSYEAVHVAKSGPATLYDRPLVLASPPLLLRLRRLLKAATVDAQAWLKPPAEPPGYLGGVYEECLLAGPRWQASVEIPLHSSPINQLKIRYRGAPFCFSDRPLFDHFPCSFLISVDGDFGGRLDSAQEGIRQGLRELLADQAERWLRQMQQEPSSGPMAQLHLEAYCSLLCLWMRPTPDQRRPLPPAWLRYPAPVSTPATAVADLLADARLRSALPPGHPLHTLADWLPGTDPSSA
jgi:hypothetical protein